MSKTNIEDIYPLSPVQQGMLFHSLSAPETSVYVEQLVCTLHGDLDVAAFERAWAAVLTRHAVLRSLFVWSRGEKPHQVVRRTVGLPIKQYDWQGLSHAEQERRLDALVEKDRRRGFNLSEAPLMRLALARTAAERFQLLWSSHHLILDGWSASLVLKEVLDLYEAFHEGCELPQKPCRPFRDYVAWLKRQDLSRAERYWRETLRGFTEPTPLMSDEPIDESDHAGTAFAEQKEQLSRRLTDALQGLARQHHLTLSTITQGAWAILLSRYSGESDVVFGITVSGRAGNLEGAESMVGMLINTLPLRVRVSGEVPLLPWQKEVQRRQGELIQFEYSPLAQVRNWSEVPRGTDLFQSIHVFENYPLDPGVFGRRGGIRIADVRALEQNNYPLTIAVMPGAEMSLHVAYDTRRFRAATVARMLGHLRSLLEGIAANPDRRIRELPWLTETETRFLLRDHNRTRSACTSERRVHELFEAQAERTPDALALISEQERLTYGELDRRANQLAHYLRDLGVGSQTRVGLLLPRSAELVVSLLAVWKAGGTYLPLDPSYPRGRLAYVMADAQPGVLLTERRLLKSLPETGAQVVCLDTRRDVISRQSIEPSCGTSATDDLAYIIYTSGSTGRPKGVMVGHRALSNHLQWMTDEFPLSESDRVLKKYSISFDTSVMEICYPLLCGAGLVFAEAGGEYDARYLLDLIEKQGVTAIDVVPSTLMTLVADAAIERCHRLRQITCGGEALDPRLVERVREILGEVTLANMYGPTEATIGATFHRCDREASLKSVPIGRPISNTEIYPLSQELTLVPVGVAGEIHIGGTGLAWGYLNRPDLTAERFLPNPFSEEPGGRLYRTGDVGRYRADGFLEFLGRCDEQVKVRGFRIEPGEIETLLKRHPAIRDALVTAHDDAGRRRLVSYVIWRDEAEVSIGELRRFLQEELPEQLIPAVFVKLSEWPLTPNGKIDRRALPPPDGTRPRLEPDYLPPRDEKEKLLAEIWSRALGLERVGVNDNFFELGGDSIISLQIVARAGQAGLVITPGQVFRHPTIAALARLANTTPAVRAEQGTVTGRVPLTPIQHWFFEQALPEPHHYNQAVMLEVREGADLAVLEESLEQLVTHHDVLRLRFVEGESGWQQFNAASENHRILAQIDLSPVSRGEQATALETAAKRAHGSLNLGEGPLVRALYFKVGSGKPGRLLILAHHLVVDAVSWRILLEDLDRIYTRLARHLKAELPLKTTSFKEWAERLGEYAQSDAVGREMEYWTAETRRRIDTLPTDGHRPAGVAPADSVLVSLSVDETRDLLHGPAAGYHARVDELSLSALALTLGRWTRSQRLLVDLEGHGREELSGGSDLSRTVGWFTAVFPVLLELDGAVDELEALKIVKDQLRAVPGRGMGYGLLRYSSRDDSIRQRLRTMPQAEVSFNYLGHLDRTLDSSSVFLLVNEPVGPARSERAARSHSIEVEACIFEGQLRVEWAYCERTHSRSTVERLAADFLAHLRTLAERLTAERSRVTTPSDFPLAKLDEPRLERMTATGGVVQDIYPLTALQQGILFHDLYGPRSGVYHTQLVCDINSHLNREHFRRAWQAVVDRHAVLRTGFEWEALEEPLQVVRPDVSLRLDEEDWRGVRGSERAARLETFLQSDRERGYTLSEPPLMRLKLFRTGDDNYRLVWSCHHLLVDGWSLAILLKEFLEHYEALCRGEAIEFTAEQPYRVYIEWFRRRDEGAAEAYWRAALRGVRQPTRLGLERGSEESEEEETADAARGEQTIRLSRDLTSQLRRLARTSRLTLNTLVKGAWAILLSRYSRETDVLFGAVVSGRPGELPGVEEMVGMFINTLPLRVKVERAARLMDWMAELQARQAEMQPFEYSSLAQVQGWSEVMGGVPLFESLLVFENYPVDSFVEARLGGHANLEINDLRAIETTNYPLALVVAPGDELKISAAYEIGRFDEETITRLLGHFETLLEAFASNPNRRVAEFTLLTERERHQLLSEWAGPETAYPSDRGIHALFEAQAERTPDAVAIRFGDRRLTYGELNLRANRLAYHLSKHGVGPEARVGICLERDVEMVLGLLAILKAGGAYVPLDPDYPRERLGFMLRDSQVRVLLTQRKFIQSLPEHGAGVVYLDADQEAFANESEQNLSIEVSGDNLAYVMYTSGSTGRPKGVCVPHRAVSRLVCNTNYTVLNSRSRVAQVSNSSFDAATFEIWGALLHGAELVGMAAEAVLSPQDFVTQLSARGVNQLFMTTALFNQTASELPGGFRSLDTLLFGGEAVDPRRVRDVLAAGPPRRLLHVYGPTETTTFATWFEVTDVPQGTTTVPIGRPITNTKVYVLDEEFEPVPVGMSGQLYIGGEGLARGYDRQPALTAESFRPDPFSRKPGQRLYRTGDIARYLPDGNVEFLGRLDEQVKIRGFRVEPGEIESELRRHPAVQEALVLTREEADRDRRLVAYVVPKQQPAPASGELLAFLRTRLPAYMLPSSFVTLSELPLTPNGKVDRSHLPAPDHARPLLGGAFAAAGTPVQDVLCGIWAELLCLERVGVHDNFFDLGGHSLLATRIVSKIRHVFEVEMPLRALFDRPTVAGLASHLEWALREQSGLQAEPLRPAAREGKVPLSFAQQRLWFLHQLEPSSSAYNIPAALHFRGVLKVGVLTRCLNEIVKRHESLRTTFPVVEGSPVQHIATAVELEVPVVNLPALSEAERQARCQSLIAEEAGRPFDLARGPLLRALLLGLAEDEHVLLLTAHHISADGWSVNVFVREMAALYEAYSDQLPSPLPELPVQYADFSIWQRQYLTGDVLAAQLAYWKRQLGGDLPVLSLPADRLRPHGRTFRGATESLRLSVELSEAVRALSRRQHATLFMTLLAAFKVLLFRYTGQRDILVGTPVANRNYRELEDLVGFFVNTLVLRTEVSEEQSFQQFLDRVKKVALDAYAHQDVPFERLIEELQPLRSLSHTPLFQVMFVLQNGRLPSIDLSGLELTSMEVESPTAKFDLTMMAEEAEPGLIVSLEYSTDLFRAATMRRMLCHFRTLLEGIVADPGTCVAELPLLAAGERMELLAHCRPRSTHPVPEVCLHHLFERWAQQSPQSVALSCDGLRMSYADLNRRANQLAHCLQALGVGPEVPVALCLERSSEMIIAILAVLKAGGAYVPLDPAWPRQRLAFIVEDTRVPLVLTESSLTERLPVTEAQVICLDRQREDIGRHSAQDCRSSVGAGNTAYVIYTSGSTGEPKGVMVTHANVARLFTSTEDDLRFSADDCWTLFHSYTFDFSVWEIWGALLSGGRLVVVPYLTSRSPEDFYRLLRRERVTVLSQTPSAFRQLSDVDERAADAGELEPLSLRVVVFGGEALDVRDLGAWMQRHGDERPRLVNMYGITETTVHVTLRRITLADARQGEAGELGSVIGEAIGDLEVHVLDERMQVLPAGVAGEMWVGGAGLARGYLGRADLTAVRFVPHPYALRAGERLYRTGDVGRRLGHGELEYVGRVDEQLKVRGFRIEPGEIEEALRQHESVEQARVLARRGGGSEKELVAYVKRKMGAEVGRADLREHSRARLPEYMIPAAFVVLDDFPVTTNGKLDLRALAKTDNPPLETGADHVEPHTEIEKTIAAVWCAVLRLERVGVQQNFFDLGGTSISMALACHRLREVLQRDISMLEMFTYTTVNSLAKHLAGAESEAATQPLDARAVEAHRETMHRRKKFRREQRARLDV